MTAQIKTEVVPIDTLEVNMRFLLQNRWYAWEQVTPGDPRMIARFLEPNHPDGEVQTSGYVMPPGILQVEVLLNESHGQRVARLQKKLDQMPPMGDPLSIAEQ
jgi:hypothetical protein